MSDPRLIKSPTRKINSSKLMGTYGSASGTSMSAPGVAGTMAQLIQAFRANNNNQDPKTGLLFHGWDESKQMPWADKTTGCSPNFWSRSIGWYVMALVDVLDYFPENHPKRKSLIGYLNAISNSLVQFQDPSGLWYQVTDKGGSEGNYLESSGSSMFAYAMAKGANKGYLPKKFKAIANKAFDGLTTR